jgi:hypothetical protein
MEWSNMEIVWIRGREHISFNRTASWFTLGVRGSGKSTLLETLGIQYLEKGHHIFDLFASRDGENLAWLRNPNVDHSDVLLVHGDNVEVVKAPCESRPVSKLSLNDLEDYKILISSSPLYSSPDDEFRQVAKITDLLYRRLSWKNLVCLLVRESANLYYSRIKIGDSQLNAKASMIYFIREARHLGITLALDTLRFTAVDIDIRGTIDFLIFKALGIQGLPRDLFWVYKYIEPSVMRRMKPSEFVIMTRTGCLGLGVFPDLSWHKRERENILKEVGIKIEYGKELVYSQDKGTFSTMGDKEHAVLVREYIESGQGMVAISKRLDISSATVSNHVRAHNKELASSGECSRCNRVDSQYSRSEAKR